MAPRTILYTGKGGVGKTSVAAATARRCAAAGLRTVVLSTDPRTRSPTCSSCRSAASRRRARPNLWAQQVSAQDELERHWSAVQGWLGQVLIERGVERIAPRSSPSRPAATSCSACCGSGATSRRAAGT